MDYLAQKTIASGSEYFRPGREWDRDIALADIAAMGEGDGGDGVDWMSVYEAARIATSDGGGPGALTRAIGYICPDAREYDFGVVVDASVFYARAAAARLLEVGA